jgi:holo-[acyl-carrier protein] synthase
LQFGLGLDIVEISRIQAVAERSKRFLARVFTPDEIAYCQAKKNPWPHFAVRFAAKEAVWKALGQKNLTLRDISVSRNNEGRPAALLRGKRLANLEVSLTHSRDYALAVAIKK